MADLLTPDPDLAYTLHRKCSTLMSSNWYGLIAELYPNVKYIYGIMTGSIEPYINKLRHYAGDLPLICADYGASEGWVGVNVNPRSPPEEATFAVLPNIGYFEFIPLDSDGRRRAVGLTEVEIGKEYEVVLTSFAGLYRYKVGDVVKVAGLHNSTPELRFVRRRNVMMSVNVNKNTEKDLQLSVEAAEKIAAAAEEEVEVVDYTSCVDSSTEPAHYVIFWEMSGERRSDGGMLQLFGSSVRGCGLRQHEEDQRHRSAGAENLEEWNLPEDYGSRRRIGRRCEPVQDATVCLGPTGEVMKIFSNNVVKTYFSSAY